MRRAIVTNGNFTAYVCDGAATRAYSQITLGRLDYYDYDYYYCYIVVKFAECTNLSKRGNLDVSCGVICVARFIFRNVGISTKFEKIYRPTLLRLSLVNFYSVHIDY